MVRTRVHALIVVKAPKPKKEKIDFTFRCSKCKTKQERSCYCIAQQAAGYDVKFTCSCGYIFMVPILNARPA